MNRTIGRPGLWSIALLALAACGGGGGGSSSSDPVATGLTASFVPDSSPACSASGDGLSLHTATGAGALITLGLQVTDCNQSLGIYGVVFDLSFNPATMQCASANPCTAGTILSSPLATSAPVCTCNNSTGEIVGAFSRVNPATNDAVGSSGQENIVLISMRALVAGSGRVDMTGQGSANGTALMTLPTNTAGELPAPIAGLTYVGGSLVAQ